SAGFRTQILVALGSALAMLVSLNFGNVYGESTAPSISVDPARVAYGVMAGIGFLGAGAIIRYGAGIRGLTTAASLWCTAAVGLACGFGMFIVATTTTVMVIFALFFLTKLNKILPSRIYRSVTITLPLAEQDNVSRLKKILEAWGVQIDDLEHERNAADAVETITFHVSISSRSQLDIPSTLAKHLPDAMNISVR
ncbi:MAG: MgtC/SapB family protein, partial [Phycisphaerae bacterium]|nr:MgtC/SapB family protein [Phycisphaerae bacterium]